LHQGLISSVWLTGGIGPCPPITTSEQEASDDTDSRRPTLAVAMSLVACSKATQEGAASDLADI